MTIAETLMHATQRLERALVDTPRLDAEVLLAHALGVKRAELVMHAREELDATVAQRFEHLVGERVQRRPVAQIVGHKGFWTLDIHVNEHVLTPRPETEGIIECAEQRAKHDAALEILDLCTGSGCIAAALAEVFPRAHITATDASPEALDLARTNLAFAADRVTLLQGNLFEVFSSSLAPHPSSRLFDLITANPPYIAENDMAELPPEVKDFEPRMALAAGPDGLAFLRKIAEDAPRFLNTDGHLIMEMGAGQADAVRKILEDTSAYRTIAITRDLAGIERIITAQRR